MPTEIDFYCKDCGHLGGVHDTFGNAQCKIPNCECETFHTVCNCEHQFARPIIQITTEKHDEQVDDDRHQIVHHVSDGQTTIMVSSVEQLDVLPELSINFSFLGIPEGYIIHETMAFPMGFHVGGDVNWNELFCLRPSDHKRGIKMVKMGLTAKYLNSDADVEWVDLS